MKTDIFDCPITKYLKANESFDNMKNFADRCLFLAAMSSSRSDVVTKFVRPCVRVFVPFFSLSVLKVSSRPKEFQWCFKTV